MYIRAKKAQAAKGLDKHICESDAETLWSISQRYGVRLRSLCKMNGLQPDAQLHEEDVIRLRMK